MLDLTRSSGCLSPATGEAQSPMCCAAPDCSLSCSHADHSHLCGADPQGVGTEGRQRGLHCGPGTAHHGPAHSHHHHLEAATEQRAVELQSEHSPQQLSTPIGPGRVRAIAGSARACSSVRYNVLSLAGTFPPPPANFQHLCEHPADGTAERWYLGTVCCLDGRG